MNKTGPLLTAMLVMVSLALCGQPMEYAEWKAESKSNIRLLPEYGNREKSKEQKDADEKFIEATVKQLGSRQKASEHMIGVGFEYLYRQDLRIAMYRFNQAWLLNPQNENVYWGFGAIYFMFNDFEMAMEQYNKGLLINPKSANLLTDKATIYITRFNMNGGKANLDSALSIFKKSYLIDAKNQNTLFKLSASYLIANDCKNARKYLDECKALGGKPITREYLAAIEKQCSK